MHLNNSGWVSMHEFICNGFARLLGNGKGAKNFKMKIHVYVSSRIWATNFLPLSNTRTAP